MSTLAAEVKNLTVKFGDFTAVDNVSFEVQKGEIFGFLGANGAGKTTTIRVMCGLLRPTEGDVQIGNVNFESNNGQDLKSKIGYMSQKFTLYNDLTVEENLSFIASLRKLDKITYEKRKKELLDLIGFSKPLKTKITELSSGSRQYVSLVAALLHNPDVVFLDEPTSGVTPASRALFWKLIQKVIAQNKTVFVTTHYLDEAEQCHRIALMRDGKLVALDTPQKLKQNTFSEPMYEFEAKEMTRFDELEKLKRRDEFAFFEPYGLRFHASPKSKEDWEKVKPELEKQFQIKEISPSLEDVFIQIVEGKHTILDQTQSATNHSQDSQ